MTSVRVAIVLPYREHFSPGSAGALALLVLVVLEFEHLVVILEFHHLMELLDHHLEDGLLVAAVGVMRLVVPL